jgi:hypothetical protein
MANISSVVPARRHSVTSAPDISQQQMTLISRSASDVEFHARETNSSQPVCSSPVPAIQ